MHTQYPAGASPGGGQGEGSGGGSGGGVPPGLEARLEGVEAALREIQRLLVEKRGGQED